MGKVVSDMSMSLDGFIAGPNDGPDLPLGEGGERLHVIPPVSAAVRFFSVPHDLSGIKTAGLLQAPPVIMNLIEL